MMDLISKKIVGIILVALFLGGASGAGAYYYIAPAKVRYEQEANSIKSKAGQVQAEIDRIRFEFDKIQSQIESFKALQAKGFFNAQDRITAREAITRLTRHAKVGADITFAAANIAPNSEVEAASYKLLAGPMDISVRSMNDVNAYRFVLGLQKAFPGYLQLQSFSLVRGADGSFSDSLKVIRGGDNKPLVTGNMKLVWWSMASEDQLRVNPILDPTAIVDPASAGVTP